MAKLATYKSKNVLHSVHGSFSCAVGTVPVTLSSTSSYILKDFNPTGTSHTKCLLKFLSETQTHKSEPKWVCLSRFQRQVGDTGRSRFRLRTTTKTTPLSLSLMSILLTRSITIYTNIQVQLYSFKNKKIKNFFLLLHGLFFQIVLLEFLWFYGRFQFCIWFIGGFQFFFFFLNRANTSDAVNYGCFNVCIV